MELGDPLDAVSCGRMALPWPADLLDSFARSLPYLRTEPEISRGKRVVKGRDLSIHWVGVEEYRATCTALYAHQSKGASSPSTSRMAFSFGAT